MNTSRRDIVKYAIAKIVADGGTHIVGSQPAWERSRVGMRLRKSVTRPTRPISRLNCKLKAVRRPRLQRLSIFIHHFHLFSPSLEPPPNFPACDLRMSTTGRTASPSQSTDNFTAIFQAASREYQRVTGKPLDTHPFSKQLDSCNSPEAVSNVLRTQAQAFSKFRQGDEKLMAWLDPTVNILFTFSATLGEGIGLVSHRGLPLSLSPDISFSAVVARESNLYQYRRSPCSESPPQVLPRAYA